MRTLRAIAVAAGLVAAAVALAAAPAGAKGPRSATIEGPGLEAPIDHRDAGYSKLPALAGLFGPLWDDPSAPLVDEPPVTDLGPAYVITWDLGEYVDEAGRSTGSPDLVRQTVYPYAAGSPLVHTEAGQPFYAEATSGGWYVAPQALRDMLISLGLPTSLEARELSAAAVPLAPGDGGGGWVVPVAGAAAGLAVGAGAGFGLVRRRTGRRTVVPG